MAMSLMGCSGTAPRTNAPRASESASASASTSASAQPSAGALTEPGADRRLGETATVEWTPKEGVDGKLAITVDKLESTSYKQTFSGWKLDEATLARAPYFVRASIKNDGKTDLGGYDAPLWGLDDEGNLVEAAAFKESFKPCAPKAFPKPFAPGASVDVCLVMLVPDQGKLVGVSFRPYEEFDPITWQGDLTPYAAPKASGSPSASPTS
ncbi:hypothetical protein [Nocardioides albus]|uniref:DUF4352 domain-containing protein n=1 Tax=Nocardioides albus TaxID=1841 RepID=A0A7W5A6Z8_9ACTN|nr:hypothetical protein [Nocardioides albus]MBB3090868.1 hypothetical protein [Nocardioides albus]